MARLLRDRYYEYAPDRAWDLATGEPVNAAPGTEERAVSDSSLAPLIEVLEHGGDGRPRWMVMETTSANGLPVLRAAAEEARARGFVPIAADVYLRLRAALAEDLRDRALLVIGRPAISMEIALAAFVDASACSVRPHVLLTFRAPVPARIAAMSARAHVVREARAVYGARSLRASVPVPLPDDVKQHLARGARAGEFVRAGRHAAAERLLRDVAGALVRRRAWSAATETYVSLGRLLLERGRAKQAEDVLAMAIGHADISGDHSMAIPVRIWQAAARIDAGQLTAAESICRAVLLAAPADHPERPRAEATLARTLLWQQRVDEAAALDLMKSFCPEHADPYVHSVVVRVLLARGDIFNAGACARHLLTSVEQSTDALHCAIALTTYIRVLLAAGDTVAAEQQLGELSRTARAARAPLRVARARLLLVDALRRTGREPDAARELTLVERMQNAAAPLLRSEIERRVRGRILDGPARAAHAPAPSSATALITIAQREEDDRTALLRLLEFTSASLQASRIDLWSADAGPMTRVLSSGSGLPTHLGERVLEAGIAIGPEQGDPSHEMCVPVRLGPKLLAALAARWPADTTPPPPAADLLALTAAVAAPRVESLLAGNREVVRAATLVPELVGGSEAIGELRKAIARAATAPFAILIEGESGVGKELVARAIHQLSPRRERRFCDINCAALPDELLESELFGHARGAFTGAVSDRGGLVEDADGGTLFLDEVVDLSPRAQAKLLRVIQQQEVRRIGETFSRKVDVRVVSAANRDLRAEAAAGRFRQDLLYRLDVIRIRIPPLRERPEDIALLATHFWRAAAARVGTHATLGHAVLTALVRYHWPGNVRELQNVIAALAVEAPTRGTVRASLLPAVITGAHAVTAGRLADARTQFERRFVEVALARAGGSRTRAARDLGLTRQGLLKLLARLGMLDETKGDGTGACSG